MKRKGARITRATRRTATEIVWDTLLYQVQTGERLLTNIADTSRTPGLDAYVDVINTSTGLYFYLSYGFTSYKDRGVYSQR